MCEILVFARNNTHPDPEKDRRGCYKRGMPVVVFEDGHAWGREESKQVWLNEGPRVSGLASSAATLVVFDLDWQPEHAGLKNVVFKSGAETRNTVSVQPAEMLDGRDLLSFVISSPLTADLNLSPCTIENDPAAWPSQGQMVILKIPGVPADKARELIAEQQEDDAGVATFSPVPLVEPLPQTYRRRRWRLLVDNLPNGVKSALVTNGEYTATPQAVRNYLKRVRDDAQYTGLD